MDIAARISRVISRVNKTQREQRANATQRKRQIVATDGAVQLDERKLGACIDIRRLYLSERRLVGRADQLEHLYDGFGNRTSLQNTRTTDAPVDPRHAMPRRHVKPGGSKYRLICCH